MKNIAILGFGNVGTKLATLFSDAEYQVTICSNDGKAGSPIYKASNIEAGIKDADAIAIAIPYSAAVELLEPLSEALAGKIIIDCTNPLNEDWSPLLLGQETSAAEQLAQKLPNAFVVKAFNTIFADVMSKEHHARGDLTISAFIASENQLAKEAVLTLAQRIGFDPIDVGPLHCARYLEAMAHLNIHIALHQGGGTDAAFIYHQKK